MAESITTRLAIGILIKKQLNNRTFKKGGVKPAFFVLNFEINYKIVNFCNIILLF